MKDLFGKAILDFQTNNSPEDLITETSISEADEMSVSVIVKILLAENGEHKTLFIGRSFGNIKFIEQFEINRR